MEIAGFVCTHYQNPITQFVPHLTAAQADFGSLVTIENPVPAGSIIHSWVAGLGPLNRPLATGEKGPSDPPAAPLAPLACYIGGQDNKPATRGLHVPTVIYAPNLAGVWVCDMEVGRQRKWLKM